MLADHVYALQQGAKLNQYEIAKVLGSGGFGITYLAQDTSLDAPVAIKEYLPSDLATRVSGTTVTAKSSESINDFKWGLDRFLDEARTMARFHHHNIVQISQVFEANSTAYIVMEYANGESLAELLQRSAPLSEQQTKDILIPIMDGLKTVHEQGYLHRDIKPGNIILRKDSGPVLIDFGAARQAIETKSRSITSIITEGYAPLEQYDPKGNQGAWTDIYALGAVAYKCLTGTTPPAATSRVRNDPLAPLSIAAKGQVSKEFAAAIEWALAVYEDQRPQNIDEFARAVGGDLSARPNPADATRLMREDSKAGQSQDATRLMREPVVDAASPQPKLPVPLPMMIAAGLLLIVLVSGGAWYWASNRVAPEDRAAWEAAAHADTITAYQEYRRVQPEGHYLARATSAISDREKVIDDAWAQAQSTNTIDSVQAFLDKYAAEDRHASEAKQKLAQLQEVRHQAELKKEQDDRAEVERQRQEQLRRQEQERIAREKAQQVAIQKREEQEAYNNATALKTRATYNAFLSRYGSSTYAADIRSRISQCHIQYTPHTSQESNSLQYSAQATDDYAQNACNAAAKYAVQQLRTTCGRSVSNPRIVDRNVNENDNAAGRWLAGRIGGQSMANMVNNTYTCELTVAAECEKTVTTNSQSEVCP